MATKRIWLNEHDFMELPTNPLLAEIAVRARTFDFIGMLRYLPNPDIVLKKIGKRLDVYDELLYDGHVGGARTKRKAGVLRSSWYLDHKGIDPNVAGYVDRLFLRIDTERLVSELLDAPFYGFQPAELVYESRGEEIGITNVIAKPPRWFNFSPENQLQFISTKNWMGEELPPNKFIVAQHDAKHDNPYGHSVLSRCFWPVTFKRGGLPFWARFVEKYGIPFLFGEYPENWSDQSKIDQFRDTLDDMVQDGVAALPAGAKANVVQVNGTGATDIQERFIAAMNSEIAVAILGHSAAVSSTPGKLGSESNVSEASADIVGMDKSIVKKAMNDLIDIAVNMNFGGVPRSRFKFIEEQDIKAAQAGRDKTLAELGIRFHEEYFIDVYGLKSGQFHIVEPVVSAGKTPLFSDPALPTNLAGKKEHPADPSKFTDQQAVDDLGKKLTPEQLQLQMEQMLKPVMDLIAGGSTYAEVMQQLTAQFPRMNTADLEAVLERSIFMTELVGRLSADAESTD